MHRVNVVVVFALLTITLLAGPASAQSSAQVHLKINQAFEAIRSAEAEGGNVISLIKILNQAINLTERADRINATNPARAGQLYSNASSLSSIVLQQAPSTATQGRDSVNASSLDFYGETALLAILAVLAYVITPRVFWKLWLITHRKWKVRRV
jgi:hypothetical protein